MGIDRSTPPADPDLRARADLARSDPVANLAELIRSRFRDPDYRPPMLPQVALEVQRSATSTTTTFASIGAILEKDPLLTARVLHLQRAGAHGPPVPVRSLREAVGLLGLRSVVELVWRAALDIGVFRSPAHRRTMDNLRRHSTVTAYLARVAALFTPVPVEHAFLGGLVHDIGLAAALIVLAGHENLSPRGPAGRGNGSGRLSPRGEAGASARRVRGRRSSSIPPPVLADRDIRAVAAVHEERRAGTPSTDSASTGPTPPWSCRRRSCRWSRPRRATSWAS